MQHSLTSNFLAVTQFSACSTSFIIFSFPQTVNDCSHFVSFFCNSCIMCYPNVSGLPLGSQEKLWYGVLPCGGDSVYFCEQSGTSLAHLACFSVIFMPSSETVKHHLRFLTFTRTMDMKEQVCVRMTQTSFQRSSHMRHGFMGVIQGQSSSPLSRKAFHLHNQRRPGSFAWMSTACWLCLLIMMGSITMNLSHRVKLWTTTTAKVSYSVYRRLSRFKHQENGTLVIGWCIMTMLPLTPPSLCNNTWPWTTWPWSTTPVLYRSGSQWFFVSRTKKLKLKGKRF
jgi:hypothetical protein